MRACLVVREIFASFSKCYKQSNLTSCGYLGPALPTKYVRSIGAGCSMNDRVEPLLQYRVTGVFGESNQRCLVIQHFSFFLYFSLTCLSLAVCRYCRFH